MMKECSVRLAQPQDYEKIESIMKQVQELHIGWRPDIYKPCDVVMAYDEFVELLKEETLLVAEIAGSVAGVLAFVYRYVGSDKQVKRKVLR